MASLAACNAIDRWVDTMLGRTSRRLLPGDGRLIVDMGHPREIYSYGSHFPLCRYVPDAKGGPLFVLNGDRWPGGFGVTTSHQDVLRSAVEKSGVRSIIIPYSALDGAGIDRDSIRPIHVRADRTETIIHRSRRLDDVPKWQRHNGYTTSYRSERERPAGRYGWNAKWNEDRSRWEWSVDTPIYDGAHLLDPDTGEYVWTEDRHWLGDSIFSAVSETVRMVQVTDPLEIAAHEYDSRRHGRDGQITYWNRVTSRRRTDYISSFDYNERPALYFLAELPYRHGARTVDQAVDSLAPRVVHAAIARGLDVRRQGDIFAIPVDLSDAEVYRRSSRRARLSQWTHNAHHRPGEVKSYVYEYLKSLGQWHCPYPNARPALRDTLAIHGTAHTATEVAVCDNGVTYVRGTMIHKPEIGGENRDPDHARIVLGDGRQWHLMVRNTVPRRRA